MKLRAINRADIDTIRCWRNRDMSFLRTPFLLTEKMQEDWYENKVSDRNGNYRFYAIDHQTALVGYGGLLIQWENGLAEIALVIGDQGKGYGTEAVELLLDEAFNRLRLETVCFECYRCNPALIFWEKIAEKYNGVMTTLPRRKFWGGKLHDSTYGSISREAFNS
jgi:RimJ/RimL family protein N-acetyltransferase